MLKEIELENFKGIGSRCRIPLAPVTLLFGANNAGKSTILQALLYTLEVLEHGDADVGRTTLGGDQVDLGGFSRLIHRHNMEASFSIRLTFDIHGRLNCFQRDERDFPFPDLEDDFRCAWVEICASFVDGMATVDKLSIGTIDAKIPAVILHLDPAYKADAIKVSIFEEHPLFSNSEDGLEILQTREHPLRRNAGVGGQNFMRNPAVGGQRSVRNRAMMPQGERNIPRMLQAQDSPTTQRSEGTASGVLVRKNRQLEEDSTPTINFQISRTTRLSVIPPLEESIQLKDPETIPSDTLDTARLLLEMLVLSPLRQLRDLLRETLYVGPLRAIPPRHFIHDQINENRWANGLAAWNELLSGPSSLLEDVNGWLSRMGVGCTVSTQNFIDHAADPDTFISQRELRRPILITSSGAKVLPSEVGAGISQVVPVVVAALARKKGLVLLEQPELHIHPALQVNLGDLFIEASEKRQFIIETHSEHLILRLLRRIRETTEKELVHGAPEFTVDSLKVIHIDSQGGEVRARWLRVDDQGEFMDRWPSGFFEERAKELF